VRRTFSETELARDTRIALAHGMPKLAPKHDDFCHCDECLTFSREYDLRKKFEEA
jgi:hypothetical protein